MAPLPEWLIELMEQSSKKQSSYPQIVLKGQRNAFLTHEAGKLRHNGDSEDTIYEKLCEINEKRCNPPLSKNEVSNIAHSVAKYDIADKTTKKTQSIAYEVYKLIESDISTFQAQDGEYYVTVKSAGQTYNLQSQDFRDYISCKWFDNKDAVANENTRNNVQAHTRALAKQAKKQGCIYHRIARINNTIYIDLANKNNEVVKITKDGWDLISDAPVNFCRSSLMLSLPQPHREGNINDLKSLLNIENERDSILIIGWLLSTFKVDPPYYILGLKGEPGSAKSTTARILKSIIDPNLMTLRNPAADAENLYIAANQNWVVAFDNTSSISRSLADAYCRMATGTGYATRKRFTDKEESIINVARPIILNGIEFLGNYVDLNDRSIVITLPRICHEKRETQSAINKNFEILHPSILGGICDCLVTILNNQGHQNVITQSRMPDCEMWISAASERLNWQPDTFSNAYGQYKNCLSVELIEDDPVASAIHSYMSAHPEWIGTAQKGLIDFREFSSYPNNWLNTPEAFRARLDSVLPLLREIGIDIERNLPGRGRFFRIYRPDSTK